MLQLLTWLFWRRPKLKGDIERKIVRQTLGAEATQYAQLLLRVYVVNARMQPTTIRTWLLVLRQYDAIYREDSRPLDAELLDRLSDPVSLAEITRVHALDYGRGVSGWLQFDVKGIAGGALERGCRLQVIAVDSMGHKHRIRATGLRTDEIERLPLLPRTGQ